MSRINLKKNEELAPAVLQQVKAVEAMGGDTSTIRGLAHRQSLFDGFFQWYGNARKGEAVEEEHGLGGLHRREDLVGTHGRGL